MLRKWIAVLSLGAASLASAEGDQGRGTPQGGLGITPAEGYQCSVTRRMIWLSHRPMCR